MLPRTCGRIRLKYIAAFIVFVFLLDFFGAFTHYFEIDFYHDFHYPVEGDVPKYARQMRYGEKPDVDPINFYNYTFIYENKYKCIEQKMPVSPRLVIIVKSAMKNFRRREAIRKTWGHERRFSDVIVKTIFMLGKAEPHVEELQKMIDIEVNSYDDIVQGNFLDSYFNNTIKTMMGFKWAVKNCPQSKFYMFVDDDFYVSTKNVLRFIRNPVNYPEYLEEADEQLRKLARRLNQLDSVNQSDIQLAQELIANNNAHTIHSKDYVQSLRNIVETHMMSKTQKKQLKTIIEGELLDTVGGGQRRLLDIELPNDVKLFTGYVIRSAPHRHKTSKWHVSLAEYPWHMWPPYVTAGAFILSREALIDMYFASMFTQHFRFDDIYLGLVAMKALIEPLHSEEFYFHRATYTGAHSYRYVLASHGYDDPKEMAKVWLDVKAAGYA